MPLDLRRPLGSPVVSLPVFLPHALAMCASQTLEQKNGHYNEIAYKWIWHPILLEHAVRGLGLLTFEDLLRCASTCRSWRFRVLAMMSPGAPCCPNIMSTQIDLFLADFREQLTVQNALKQLILARQCEHVGAQRIAEEFIWTNWTYSESVDAFIDDNKENEVELEKLLISVVVERSCIHFCHTNPDEHLLHMHRRISKARVKRRMRQRGVVANLFLFDGN